MKYFAVNILILLSILIGCSDQTADTVIRQAELTDFEDNLVDLMGSNTFVFDMDIKNDTVKEINSTIDYYENGKFVRQIGGVGTDASGEDPIRMVFIQQALDEDREDEQWTISIMTGNGQSSSVSPSNGLEREEDMMTAAGGIDTATLTLGKKKVLATIVYSNGNGISMINDIETKEDLKKATNYEHVYVISVELK